MRKIRASLSSFASLAPLRASSSWTGSASCASFSDLRFDCPRLRTLMSRRARSMKMKVVFQPFSVAISSVRLGRFVTFPASLCFLCFRDPSPLARIASEL